MAAGPFKKEGAWPQEQERDSGQKEEGKAKGKGMQRAGQQAAALARPVAPFEQMDRLFENLLPRSMLRPFGGWWEWPEMASIEARVPRIELIDSEGEVCLRAELPGVQKKDVDVSITQSTIIIKGTTQHSTRKWKKRASITAVRCPVAPSPARCRCLPS